LEPWIDGGELREAAHQQPARGEQDHRESKLQGHEPAEHPPLATARRTGPAPFFQRIACFRPRRLPCRHEPADERRRDGECHRECEHGDVDADLVQ
jgi:hypothetical protein